MSADILLDLAVIGIATVVVWKACDRLEDTCHDLAMHYGLPEAVKGSTIMAISSSFPELATVVLAGLVHGNYELGLATIIGSAIFNILVIPGVSVLFRKGSLDADRNIIYRETQFYLISVMIVMLCLCFAVIYHPVEGDQPSGSLTRSLVLVPLLFYGLYIYIQLYEVHDHNASAPEKVIRPHAQWGWLLLSMLVVTAGVEVMIRVIIGLGETLSIPSYFLGATILAAATSVPDLFVSINAAQRTQSAASMSNAIGSNTFDLLVVIPAGVLVAGAATISFANTIPMMMFLVLATVALLIMARRGFKLTNLEGVVLLLLYLGFIIWIAQQSLGLSSPV